jgi:hypothetical protein
MKKNMWTIGIKSGLITVLGLLAYGLVIQLMGLQYSLWGNLEYAVLALGIYSGHYYYKAANNGSMTYQQGLRLGGIIASFTGLVNALPIYLYIKLTDASYLTQLAENVQRALRQKGIDETVAEKIIRFMQHMPPEFLLIGIFVSTVLLGIAFTLVIAAFSKTAKKTAQP